LCASPADGEAPHAVARLLAKHGDAKLTDLLFDLAQCKKARSLGVHNRCKAVYESLAIRRMTSE
jgi:hypothetical protein